MPKKFIATREETNGDHASKLGCRRRACVRHVAGRPSARRSRRGSVGRQGGRGAEKGPDGEGQDSVGTARGKSGSGFALSGGFGRLGQVAAAGYLPTAPTPFGGTRPIRRGPSAHGLDPWGARGEGG